MHYLKSPYKAIAIFSILFIVQIPVILYGYFNTKAHDTSLLKLNSVLLEQRVINLIEPYGSSLNNKIAENPYIDQSGSWVLLAEKRTINLLEKSFELYEMMGASLSFVVLNANGRVILKSPDQAVSFGQKIQKNNEEIRSIKVNAFMESKDIVKNNIINNTIISFFVSVLLSLLFLSRDFHKENLRDRTREFKDFFQDAVSDYRIYLSCVRDALKDSELNSNYSVKKFWNFFTDFSQNDIVNIKEEMNNVCTLFKTHRHNVDIKLKIEKESDFIVFDKNFVVIISVMVVELLILSQNNNKKKIYISIKREKNGLNLNFFCKGPFLNLEMRGKILKGLYKNGNCKFLNLSSFDLNDFRDVIKDTGIVLREKNINKGTNFISFISNEGEDNSIYDDNIIKFKEYKK
jgi:hypothetical protein